VSRGAPASGSTAPCAPGDVMSPHIARFFPDTRNRQPQHSPSADTDALERTLSVDLFGSDAQRQLRPIEIAREG